MACLISLHSNLHMPFLPQTTLSPKPHKTLYSLCHNKPYNPVTPSSAEAYLILADVKMLGSKLWSCSDLEQGYQEVMSQDADMHEVAMRKRVQAMVVQLRFMLQLFQYI